MKKLKKEGNLFATLGLEETRVEDNLLSFRANRKWNALRATQKEQFLSSMLTGWKQATNGSGRIEIQDTFTGKTIAKAGVWGIKIDE